MSQNISVQFTGSTSGAHTHTTGYVPPVTRGRLDDLAAFEKRHGRFGHREIRQVPIDVAEIRDSGDKDSLFTVRGHAAVFDKWSLDLGGFREKIAPSAFDNVIRNDPTVFLLWDHDTLRLLASTKSKNLDLRLDPQGLHYWGRVADTSYARDLRVLMERGDINESSFAFTVKRDEWLITGEGDDEQVERTILEIGDLFDVTVTAMGAYPQTDSQIARQLARDYARSTGRLTGADDAETPVSDVDTPDAPPNGDADGRHAAPAEPPVGEETTAPTMRDIAKETSAAVQEMRERHLRAMKELMR